MGTVGRELQDEAKTCNGTCESNKQVTDMRLKSRLMLERSQKHADTDGGGGSLEPRTLKSEGTEHEKEEENNRVLFSDETD